VNRAILNPFAKFEERSFIDCIAQILKELTDKHHVPCTVINITCHARFVEWQVTSGAVSARCTTLLLVFMV